ncbi:hypothetical protein D3C72_1976380 [compost metagenome]
MIFSATSPKVTLIIAPPAKAKISGRFAAVVAVKSAPRVPPKISIRPVAVDPKKAALRENPIERNAAAVARPSGKFCTTIAITAVHPAAEAGALSAAPEARPSGRLCNIIAMTKSHALE